MQVVNDVADKLRAGVSLQAVQKRAADLANLTIQVNARDLTDFSVCLDRTEQLLADIPTGPVTVAESGIYTPHDAQRMRTAGADAILVGTALMESTDPARLLAQLRAGAQA